MNQSANLPLREKDGAPSRYLGSYFCTNFDAMFILG
jgi:hypothetical protein